MDKLVQQVKENPYSIKRIKNPSYEVQMAAISKDISIFKDIKNPDIRVINEVLDREPGYIVYIKNPPYEIIERYINKNYHYASLFSILPVELQNLVLDLGGAQAIEFIRTPAVCIQQRAFIMDMVKALPYITDKKLLIDIIREFPKAIMYINNPSEELQLECIKRDKRYIKYINNPTNKVKNKAR